MQYVSRLDPRPAIYSYCEWAYDCGERAEACCERAATRVENGFTLAYRGIVHIRSTAPDHVMEGVQQGIQNTMRECNLQLPPGHPLSSGLQRRGNASANTSAVSRDPVSAEAMMVALYVYCLHNMGANFVRGAAREIRGTFQIQAVRQPENNAFFHMIYGLTAVMLFGSYMQGAVGENYVIGTAAVIFVPWAQIAGSNVARGILREGMDTLRLNTVQPTSNVLAPSDNEMMLMAAVPFLYSTTLGVASVVTVVAARSLQYGGSYFAASILRTGRDGSRLQFEEFVNESVLGNRVDGDRQEILGIRTAELTRHGPNIVDGMIQYHIDRQTPELPPLPDDASFPSRVKNGIQSASITFVRGVARQSAIGTAQGVLASCNLEMRDPLRGGNVARVMGAPVTTITRNMALGVAREALAACNTQRSHQSNRLLLDGVSSRLPDALQPDAPSLTSRVSDVCGFIPEQIGATIAGAALADPRVEARIREIVHPAEGGLIGPDRGRPCFVQLIISVYNATIGCFAGCIRNLCCSAPAAPPAQGASHAAAPVQGASHAAAPAVARNRAVNAVVNDASPAPVMTRRPHQATVVVAAAPVLSWYVPPAGNNMPVEEDDNVPGQSRNNMPAQNNMPAEEDSNVSSQSRNNMPADDS